MSLEIKGTLPEGYMMHIEVSGPDEPPPAKVFMHWGNIRSAMPPALARRVAQSLLNAAAVAEELDAKRRKAEGT